MQTMKSIFRILPLVFAIVLISCQKEELTPATPGGNSMVHVEYRVYAVSANATVYQDVPVAGQTTLSEEKVTIDRTTYTYSFDVLSGTTVGIDATNSNPGSEEVIAEIYVNNQLLASASASAPGAYASASGIAR